MTRHYVALVVCTVTMLWNGSTAIAQDGPETVEQALRSGTFRVDFRYRFESVTDDARPDDASASTLRTTLGYRSAALHGFRLFVQAENVADVWLGDHHDNAGADNRNNDVARRPVIADPPGSDFLQWNLEYSNGSTTVRAGRQEILLDDQRFVGAVGWRQHHQTFRALRVHNTSVTNLTAQYAYIDRVDRIFGDARDADTHLVNARYALEGLGAVTGYVYLVKFDAPALAALATNTYGLEFKGSRPAGRATVQFEIELARQRDAAVNPARVRANYAHVSLGATVEGVALTFGWERLDGDPTNGRFQTPLATGHAFNGWADRFLSTPLRGLEDRYTRASGQVGGVAWTARYHLFRSADRDLDYGTEFDAQFTYPTSSRQVVGVKGAFYRADQFSTDTTKLWLFTTYGF